VPALRRGIQSRLPLPRRTYLPSHWIGLRCLRAFTRGPCPAKGLSEVSPPTCGYLRSGKPRWSSWREGFRRRHQHQTNLVGSFPFRGLCISPLVSYSARAGSTRAANSKAMRCISGAAPSRPISYVNRRPDPETQKPTNCCAPGADTPDPRIWKRMSLWARARLSRCVGTLTTCILDHVHPYSTGFYLLRL